MTNVFTYGTLMFRPVWEHVVSGRYASVSATVLGFARYAVQNEHYPGCLAREGGRVAGTLYVDVSSDDVARLDAFEGAHYARAQCLVRLDQAAQMVPAWIYLYLLPQQLRAQDWQPQHFTEKKLSDFLENYVPTTRDVLP
jgi:gamma-glutamylcyclotransferase (GGCT)/AIG2-like uncharacterized protein YtfP